jgi:hypothetical protein
MATATLLDIFDAAEAREHEPHPVPGYPGYHVSRSGGAWVSRGGRLVPLKAQTNEKGYLYIWANREDGRRHKRKLHQLVLETFVGPRPKGLECLHGDDDRTNNHVSNLRWGTRRENEDDRRDHGVILRGDRHPQAKLTSERVKEIDRAHGKASAAAVGRAFGVSRSTVQGIWSGETWSHVTGRPGRRAKR